jgi:outer membrane lipoprotein SlyB
MENNMAIQNNFKLVLSVTTLLLFGACADRGAPANPAASNYPQSSANQLQYGVVQSIDLVQQAPQGNNGIGAGTIAGAVVGGILGHQIGGGSGNTAATVLGAAGGAYAAHALEQNQQAGQAVNAYKFTVRRNDGSYQTVIQTDHADIRVGDRVQIDNGVVRRY